MPTLSEGSGHTLHKIYAPRFNRVTREESTEVVGDRLG
jgi:hypothetical protein